MDSHETMYVVRLTVKSNASRDSTAADQGTPHLINSDGAFTRALGDLGSTLKMLLHAKSGEEHDQSSDQLTNTLHGEDGTHHGSTPLSSSEPSPAVRA